MSWVLARLMSPVCEAHPFGMLLRLASGALRAGSVAARKGRDGTAPISPISILLQLAAGTSSTTPVACERAEASCRR
jgi:hypothetical protein